VIDLIILNSIRFRWFIHFFIIAENTLWGRGKSFQVQIAFHTQLVIPRFEAKTCIGVVLLNAVHGFFKRTLLKQLVGFREQSIIQHLQQQGLV